MNSTYIKKSNIFAQFLDRTTDRQRAKNIGEIYPINFGTVFASAIWEFALGLYN